MARPRGSNRGARAGRTGAAGELLRRHQSLFVAACLGAGDRRRRGHRTPRLERIAGGQRQRSRRRQPVARPERRAPGAWGPGVTAVVRPDRRRMAPRDGRSGIRRPRAPIRRPRPAPARRRSRRSRRATRPLPPCRGRAGRRRDRCRGRLRSADRHRPSDCRAEPGRPGRRRRQGHRPVARRSGRAGREAADPRAARPARRSRRPRPDRSTSIRRPPRSSTHCPASAPSPWRRSSRRAHRSGSTPSPTSGRASSSVLPSSPRSRSWSRSAELAVRRAAHAAERLAGIRRGGRSPRLERRAGRSRCPVGLAAIATVAGSGRSSGSADDRAGGHPFVLAGASAIAPRDRC